MNEIMLRVGRVDGGGAIGEHAVAALCLRFLTGRANYPVDKSGLNDGVLVLYIQA